MDRRLALALLLSISSTVSAQSVQQVLYPPAPLDGDEERFGTDVCGLSDVDGDAVSDFAVYSPRSPFGADPSVRIYSGSDRSILLSFSLGGLPGSSEGPGWSDVCLADAGDVDNDGVPDLLIGVPNYSTGTPSDPDGRVLVLSLRTGELVRIHPSTSPIRLGASVIGIGDVNGDGWDDYAAGAPEGGLANSGAVYLYSGQDGSLIHQQLNPLLHGNIGQSLAVAGDVDGDGIDELITGGNFHVVVFKPSGVLVRTHSGGYSFGRSLVGLGDVNGDGRDDYVIGEPLGEDWPTGEIGEGRVAGFNGWTGSQMWSAYGGVSSLSMGQELARVPVSGFDWVAIACDDRVLIRAGATGALVKTLYPAPLDLDKGLQVAELGDVNGNLRSDLLVGRSSSSAGAVSLYDGTTSVLIDQLEARTGQASGAAVALLGDVNGDGVPDTAVGAPHDDQPGYDAGTVRVRSGATGSELWSYGGLVGEQVGFALATLSDLNSDGVRELAVGAPRRLHTSAFLVTERAGAVHVLSGVDGALLYSVFGDEPGDLFGSAVVEVGDINGDGTPDFAAGAPGRYVSGFFGGFNGRVSVHSGVNGAVLGARNGLFQGQMGSALAGMGDVDGDGLPDLAVGSPGGTNTVDVLSCPSLDSIWSEWDGGGTALGAALASLGDLDGDGISDLAAGAPEALVGGVPTGRVRVFSGASGVVLTTLEGTFDDSRFGASVAGPGDIDADGIPDIAVGEPDSPGSFLVFDAGRVTVFSGSGSQAIRSWQGGIDGAHIGGALASGGDYDGDGLPDLAMGGPGYGGALGFAEALVTRAKGTTPFGNGTEGCSGANLLVADVAPEVGVTLELRGTSGATTDAGVLAISFGQDLAGTDWGLGALFHFDLAQLVLFKVALTDAEGRFALAVPVPNNPNLAGLELYAQGLFYFGGSPCPELPQSLSSSYGLSITLLP